MSTANPAPKPKGDATGWDYYLTAGEAWEAMLEECGRATESIDFEQFIFRRLKIGKRFLTLFEQKAREGVKVRLLLDMVGSYTMFYSLWRWRLRRQGVEIMFYNPIVPWKIFSSCGIFPRDHRKITVVDRKVAFTGGVCIDGDMEDWRDTHVRLTGEVVPEIQYTFDSIWDSTKKDGCRAKVQPYDGDMENTLYLNEPVSNRPVLRQKILERLEKATECVFITTPYFVPARSFTRRVCALLGKGVKVSFMVSGHATLSSYVLARQEAGSFLKSGARYFIYDKSMLHAKTFVIDDDFAAIGSFNVDNLSFYYNQEADVVSHDPEVVATLRSHFEADLPHCREFTYADWQNRALSEKLFALMLLPLRRFF